MPTGKYKHKKGYKRPLSVCEKISKGLTGRIFSPSSIEKMSISHIGKSGYWKGKKRPDMVTDEWKRKLSVSARGRTITEETKNKISKALKNNVNAFQHGLSKALYCMERHKLQHRLVMEKHLGRILLSTEVVHHKDEDKKNNNIDNLILFNSENEHRAYHKFKRSQSK
jgi:hypothetical protein